MSETEGLTVLGLEGTNVRRLKVVRIAPLPPTGTVKISGKNNAGKSSTLDLILLAFAGKRSDPVKPIRDGETRAKDVIELQDAAGQPALRVTRIWTEGGSRLEVEREGRPVKSPQEFLDQLAGAGLGFDPMAFCRQSPADQVDQLLGVLKLEQDPRELDTQRKGLYDERTIAGRELKRLQGHQASLKAPAKDTPDEEVSVADLTTKLDHLMAEQRDYDQAASDVERNETTVKRAQAAVDAARKALATAEAELRDHQKDLEVNRSFLASKPPPDLAPVQAQLRDAEGINTAVRAKKAYRDATAATHAQGDVVDDLAKRIKAIDEKKRALLATAAFPVPDLGFDDIDGKWHVTYQGHPLKDCATSIQIRVGMAVAMATNPRLRVILVRDGSLLDEDARAMVDQLAQEHGFQVWLEIVGEDDPEAFVILDGGVVREPQRRAQAEVAW